MVGGIIVVAAFTLGVICGRQFKGEVYKEKIYIQRARTEKKTAQTQVIPLTPEKESEFYRSYNNEDTWGE